MAEHRNYYDISLDDEWECSCGRRFLIKDEFEPYSELYDVHCPDCGRMVLIVSLPTASQVREAAAAGNPEAMKELEAVERAEARWKRASELKLRRASQLPPVGGHGPVELELQIVHDENEEHWFSFRYGEEEVWRELAVWEGMDRFCELRQMMVERYAPRPVTIEMGEGVINYLCGDRYGGVPEHRVESLPPTSIRGQRPSEGRVEDAPFDPCFDLYVGANLLATVFYDDKPDCAYASVEVVREQGELELVPGAEAGLDEDPVGWCLQFSDQPRGVHVILRQPTSWHLQARALGWSLLAERVHEHRGFWLRRPHFRIWEHADDEPD